MESIISQLKYDIQQIESKLKAIKKAEKEMLSLENTPAFKTRQLAIDNWQNEIKEHIDLIDVYYLKLKSI
tara:strand:+ start:83 stop:292 length:210 start_codon:yes stop_codon:yes gene_type:complete